MSWQYLNETNKNFVSFVKMSYKDPMDYWFKGRIYDLDEDEKIHSFLQEFDKSEYNLMSIRNNEYVFYELSTSNKDLAILFRLMVC